MAATLDSIRHRKLRTNCSAQNPMNPAQTDHSKMMRLKILPYRACTVSGLFLVLFARLKPALRTVKKLVAVINKANTMAAIPRLPRYRPSIADIALTSRAVELMMASKVSSMVSDTPPQTGYSAIPQRPLIHLQTHELDQFPSNPQKSLCWNCKLVHSSFEDSIPASR
jgi:hypothetical protein